MDLPSVVFDLLFGTLVVASINILGGNNSRQKFANRHGNVTERMVFRMQKYELATRVTKAGSNNTAT